MRRPESATGRIPELDIMRALALVAMGVYHFAFDLELFGMLAPGTTANVFWRSFAIMTAGSFLMISGVSLWLAHSGGVRWRSFVRRFMVVALAAGAVSAATYIVMPDRFVHFGILHCIAVSSLAGLAFLRVPAPLCVLVAALVLWLPTVFRSDVFNAPWLVWTGLATRWPPSIDFEPFFPWFAPFLLGIALAGASKRRILESFPGSRGAPLSGTARALAWAGRNSLLVYLAHQPVLLALTWTIAQVL